MIMFIRKTILSPNKLKYYTPPILNENASVNNKINFFISSIPQGKSVTSTAQSSWSAQTDQPELNRYKHQRKQVNPNYLSNSKVLYDNQH